MNPRRTLLTVATTSGFLAGGLLTGIAVVAFGAQAPAPTATDLAPTAATKAQRIELKDVDRSADPCGDFDAYANNVWRAANPLPSGVERWTRRTAAREANRKQLTAILEDVSAKRSHARGSVDQQLGDYSGACMDAPAIEAAEMTPIAPLLSDIAAVQDGAGVQRVIRRLHDLSIPVPFVLTSAFDYHDPELFVANIAAGGLGLPDRDAYLKAESSFVEMRAKYHAHVARVLTLGGMEAGAVLKAANEIVALETRLAEASLTADAAADPAATSHKLTFAQLTRLAPRLDWDSYFADAKLPRIDVNVAEPAFIERLNRELETTSVATWKLYLTWHVLESASPWLSKTFTDESFTFRDKYLGGASAPKARASLCLASAEALLGEPLGRKYVERHFPPASKARVQEMIRTMLAVFKDDVRELKWMSDATKQEALAKIETYDAKVGYPDTWTDVSSVQIRRDSFWANVAGARRFNVETDRKRIGTRTTRATWQSPPSSSGAYIDIQLNVMGLPAGFLQPWGFDPEASDAVNYGAIGAGIAHDITHSIDALGQDFDARSQPRKWWTQPDLNAFQRIGQCTADQYSGYAIEPGLNLRGAFVQGEALGDLAGVQLAYRALQRSMKNRPVPTIDRLTPDQQFFVAWGQFRGGIETLKLQRDMVKSDPHATARYRVIGPLSNMAAFQDAFSCKAGAAMVRPPAQRCTAWSSR